VAYETGAASSLDDLLSKLFTFATANGWTQDQYSSGTGQAAMHKNSVWVSFRWNTTTPLVLGIYQALGYTGGNQPGNHPDDSGNGSVSSTNSVLDDERCVNDIGNGPFPAYYFFENDASPAYISVVVEISTDVYRHFGYGEIIKTGDWTGGEYCYGQVHLSASPNAIADTCGLDGLFSATGTSARRAATIHLEGLPAQGGTGKWGQVWGSASAIPNDRAGIAKIDVQGGFRGGPVARHFGKYSAGTQSGLIPMYTTPLFYKDRTNSRIYFLGFRADVRGINMKFFAPGDEVVIGSDTWCIFPYSQKIDTGITNGSYNSGIAYKKVTA
jgi:hypothetical protein